MQATLCKAAVTVISIAVFLDYSLCKVSVDGQKFLSFFYLPCPSKAFSAKWTEIEQCAFIFCARLVKNGDYRRIGKAELRQVHHCVRNAVMRFYSFAAVVLCFVGAFCFRKNQAFRTSPSSHGSSTPLRFGTASQVLQSFARALFVFLPVRIHSF